MNHFIEALAIGGKVVIISFHSLEDRLVKQHYKQMKENDFEPEKTVKMKNDLLLDEKKKQKILAKLKIPKSLLNNKVKLVNYFTNNPQILNQFLVLVGEAKKIKTEASLPITIKQITLTIM